MSAVQGSNDVLKKHSYVYIAVLMTPVLGIIVALVLITYLGHPKLNLIFLILSLVMAQYLILVAYIWVRITSKID